MKSEKTREQAARILSNTVDNMVSLIKNAIRWDSPIMAEQAVEAVELAAHWARRV